jgi:hypothetical protein
MGWERDQVGWIAVVGGDNFPGSLDFEIQHVIRLRYDQTLGVDNSGASPAKLTLYPLTIRIQRKDFAA